MITDRRILTAKINLYGISSFHFYRWNQLKLIPLPSLHTPQENVPTPKRFAFLLSHAYYALYAIYL